MTKEEQAVLHVWRMITVVLLKRCQGFTRITTEELLHYHSEAQTIFTKVLDDCSGLDVMLTDKETAHVDPDARNAR